MLISIMHALMAANRFPTLQINSGAYNYGSWFPSLKILKPINKINLIYLQGSEENQNAF